MPEQKDVCETPSKYLPLYFNYLNQFALLTDEQVGRLIRALLLHGRDGAAPDFDKNSSIYMAYSFILDNSERAQGRQQAARRLGGINRAANAQKDEKGRFLPKATSNHPENVQLSPAEVQLNPAKSSTSSKTSYNNNKYKDKNKDKNEEHYAELERLTSGIPVDSIIIDPSAASFIETIRRHGRYRVRQAENDVLNGIRVTACLLSAGKMQIDRSCKDSLREFGSYRWDEKKHYDAVLKEHDHAMDDTRYFAATVLSKELRWVPWERQRQ